jgi:2-keto-4-pentenoate hydratase/2-oxohepta-3-ene-1,7-dioic acid hydratase in catechol pathway
MMKIARFEIGGRICVGLVDGEEVIDVSSTAPHLSIRVEDLLAGGEEARAALSVAARRGRRHPLTAVTLKAPVPRPGKVLGIGLNYLDHARETGREPPSVQLWFTKQASSVNDPFAPVGLPFGSSALDYEAELVLVIGRRGRRVPRERAGEIIGGYMCGCDYSVRDWQRASPTMIMGKGGDTHAPTGPWVTTVEEPLDLAGVGVRCLVNGELRQNGRASDMIFDLGAQIEHLTRSFTLEPGDLIFTGTPAGVGAAHTPPKFLKAGDVVRVELDHLGAIEATIHAEEEAASIG